MDTMLSKALREFTTGPLNQLIVNLGGQDGDQWEQQLKQFLRKEPCWTNGQVTQVAEPKPTPSILELVSTIVVNATTGKLVAKEKFVRDTGRKAKVKISYLGDNFTSWFLNGDGKTEDSISEQTLRYHKLRQSSVDGPIIAELGGAEKSETTLSEMFSLMEKQGKGEDGVLLNNGYANIFYIKDDAGVLRAVRVRWRGGGWLVCASSVEGPRRWDDGDQVFSRNSVLESSEPSAPAQA
ncbi:MAG: hypothetical protein Q8L64_06935 [bacterium]|nr:hypothetical protein [bacterium]